MVTKVMKRYITERRIPVLLPLFFLGLFLGRRCEGFMLSGMTWRNEKIETSWLKFNPGEQNALHFKAWLQVTAQQLSSKALTE